MTAVLIMFDVGNLYVTAVQVKLFKNCTVEKYI